MSQNWLAHPLTSFHPSLSSDHKYGCHTEYATTISQPQGEKPNKLRMEKQILKGNFL